MRVEYWPEIFCGGGLQRLVAERAQAWFQRCGASFCGKWFGPCLSVGQRAFAHSIHALRRSKKDKIRKVERRLLGQNLCLVQREQLAAAAKQAGGVGGRRRDEAAADCGDTVTDCKGPHPGEPGLTPYPAHLVAMTRDLVIDVYRRRDPAQVCLPLSVG